MLNKLEKYNQVFWIICITFFADAISMSFAQEYDKTTIEKKHKIVDSLNSLSFSLRGTNPSKTISVGKQALKIAKEITYTKGILMSLSFIGVGYRNLSDYSSAFKYYFDSFHLADSANHLEQKAYALNNIGNLYTRQGKDSLALISINESLKIANQLDNKKIIAYCYINFGRIYSKQEDWNNAIYYYQNALIVREKLDDMWSIANTYTELAEALRQKKDYSNSYNSFNKALEIALELENGKSIVAESYLGFGKIFRNQFDYINSNRYLEKSIVINKSIDHLDRVAEAYNIIYENYASLEDYKNSYENFLLFKNYKDSVVSLYAQRTVANLEIKYETEKKEKDNELLRHKNEISEHKLAKQESFSRLLTIIVSLVGVIAFVLLGLFTQKNRLTKILRSKNLEIEKQRIELQNLNVTKDKFFSIISHDLKSPFTGLLGSVSMLDEIYDELSEEERRTILSGMHQSTKTIQELLVGLLDWARTQQGNIEFNPEIINISQLVEDLISVYSTLAKNKRISLINNLPHDLVLFSDENILKTIFRNLIANAIKFTTEDGVVKIFQEKDNKYSKIIVQDNGVGIKEEDQKKLFRIDEHISTEGTNKESGTGLGLILCKELVEKQGGTIGVESKNGFGSKFYFTVPLYTNEQQNESSKKAKIDGIASY